MISWEHESIKTKDTWHDKRQLAMDHNPKQNRTRDHSLIPCLNTIYSTVHAEDVAVADRIIVDERDKKTRNSANNFLSAPNKLFFVIIICVWSNIASPYITPAFAYIPMWSKALEEKLHRDLLVCRVLQRSDLDTGRQISSNTQRLLWYSPELTSGRRRDTHDGDYHCLVLLDNFIPMYYMM